MLTGKREVLRRQYRYGASASSCPPPLRGQDSVISMCRGLMACALGTVTVSTPSCRVALTSSGLTSAGRRAWYSKRPMGRSGGAFQQPVHALERLLDLGGDGFTPAVATNSLSSRLSGRRHGVVGSVIAVHLREIGPCGSVSMVRVPAEPVDSTADGRPLTPSSSPATPRRPMNADSLHARTRCSCTRNSVYCTPVPCRCAATTQPTKCVRLGMCASRVARERVASAAV
jgi:hypothetical protein